MTPSIQIGKIKTDPKKGTATLTFGDETTLAVALDVYLTSNIRPDSAVAPEALESLRLADERHRCRQKAWKSISQRPRSRAELEKKLRGARFPAPLITEILDDLQAKGYLDDSAYARRLVEERSRQGRGGPNLLRHELKARGLKDDVAAEAIQPVKSRESQRTAATELLAKWNRRTSPADPQKRRLAAASFLARRGFDAEVVWEVVRRGLQIDED